MGPRYFLGLLLFLAPFTALALSVDAGLLNDLGFNDVLGLTKKVVGVAALAAGFWAVVAGAKGDIEGALKIGLTIVIGLFIFAICIKVLMRFT